MKKVTIMIPCYNEEKCIGILYNVIKSVTSKLENYDWELLFINDGSSDHTNEILEELQETYQGISEKKMLCLQDLIMQQETA